MSYLCTNIDLQRAEMLPGWKPERRWGGVYSCRDGRFPSRYGQHFRDTRGSGYLVFCSVTRLGFLVSRCTRPWDRQLRCAN